ncbi:unnamed protein product [Merluccius merluccius]
MNDLYSSLVLIPDCLVHKPTVDLKILALLEKPLDFDGHHPVGQAELLRALELPHQLLVRGDPPEPWSFPISFWSEATLQIAVAGE